MAASLVMVFLPSDIFTCHDPGGGQAPKTLYLGTLPIWSTGKLEYAIAHGYECWVLLAFPAVIGRDDWWLALVKGKVHKTIDLDDGMDMTSMYALDAMRELYAELNLPWDESWSNWHSPLNALSNSAYPNRPPLANVALARELAF